MESDAAELQAKVSVEQEKLNLLTGGTRGTRVTQMQDEASVLLREVETLKRDGENCQIQLQRREFEIKQNERQICNLEHTILMEEMEQKEKAREIQAIDKELRKTSKQINNKRATMAAKKQAPVVEVV